MHFNMTGKTDSPDSPSNFTGSLTLSASSIQAQKQPPAFIRTDFYFSDGNIVLLVPPCVFRVHKGQLGRHSEVFDGMFDVPQPCHPTGSLEGANKDEREGKDDVGKRKCRSRTGSLSHRGTEKGSTSPRTEDAPGLEMYDGCQTVRLWDDPQDVYYFLKSLYDGLYVPPTPSPTTFPIISAILRLSTKYMVPHLRRICISHLLTYWPTTLQGWDAREQLATFPFGVVQTSAQASQQSTPGTNSMAVHVPGPGMSGQTVITPPIPFSVPVAIINQPIQPQSFPLPLSALYPQPLTVTAGRYTPREFYPHPIQVILLALELDIPELLVPAFYDLSRYGPSKIMCGVHLQKTTFEEFVEWHSLAQGVQLDANDERNAYPRITRLPNSLLRRTLKGRERGQEFFTKWVHQMMTGRKPSERCSYSLLVDGLATSAPVPSPMASSLGTGGNPSNFHTFGGYWQINLPIQANMPPQTFTIPPGISTQLPVRPSAVHLVPNVQFKENHCVESFSHIHLNLLRSITGISHGRDADPLYTLLQAIDMLYRTDFSDGEKVCGLKICDECKKEFVEEVREARVAVYSKIPTWFGLEGDEDQTSAAKDTSTGGSAETPGLGGDQEAVHV
ncbi:hypothetical protein BDN72DRAFT_881571 [Pluteus cervinus]|uniref:Uncharacterized protein n=1 Tax=Pluteus cervinus TaxID=181527 RepID=A0ACD3AFJ6_9AGAR|nr:hypothetical protein BDN72DRAFT_881571 [Pluteus cervinus]